MSKRLFGSYGRLCASHPWEVIVGTLTFTTAVMSLSFFTSMDKVCGGGRNVRSSCSTAGQPDPLKLQQLQGPPQRASSDMMLLMLTECLAVLYIYLQFRSLRKLGSKYILGIAGLFTVFSSFVFTTGVINFVGSDLTGLNEALPFFLLLMDLSKASALAKYALTSSTKEEVFENIGKGMSFLGPTITLDALVEILLIGVGTMSGVPQLEMICCFGCMSIIANYLVFMTFFPACLSLVLEVSRTGGGESGGESKPIWQLHVSQLSKFLEEELDQKPNPVVQRVKLIMSAGLVIVHASSRLYVVPGVGGKHGGGGGELVEPGPTTDHLCQTHSLLWNCLRENLGFGLEQLIVLGFALSLSIKYIFFDNLCSSEVVGKRSKRDVKEDLAKKRLARTKRHATTICFFQPGVPDIKETAEPLLVTTSSPENSSCEEPDDPSSPSSPFFSSPSPFASPSLAKRQSSSSLQHLARSESSATLKADEDEESGGEDEDRVSRGEVFSSRTSQASVTSPRQKPAYNRSKSMPSDRISFRVGGDESSSSEDESIRIGNKGVQTEISAKDLPAEVVNYLTAKTDLSDDSLPGSPKPLRGLHECVNILNNTEAGPKSLTDDEVIQLVHSKHIPAYRLESMLADAQRGVAIRRRLIGENLSITDALDKLPYVNYDYKDVLGSCCENVIGYMPVPVGVAGPLLLNGRNVYVPMATTEGCLIASTNRGCRALASCGGVRSNVFRDGMTRAPVVRLPTAEHACNVKRWLERSENFTKIQESFNSTSSYARLDKIAVQVSGRKLYIRFKASTGDAMGMNMISKGAEQALKTVQEVFPELDIISLSGNACTDKKPSAVNWICGRGKSVVCEAMVSSDIIKKVLKSTASDLVELNLSKNLVGSAMAGSIGGNNAHAANIVTAIYIATGQDPAQNVSSSNCMTELELVGGGNAADSDLYITCTMPSIEVGTVGGGTILPAQAACLKMLGVQGSAGSDNGGESKTEPGDNARQLAAVVCGTVLAGELSLLSALAAGHLVRSHLTYNRSSQWSYPSQCKPS